MTTSRDSLDEILEDHRVKWLNMLSELNDELITVPEMLKVKAEIISEAKQAIHQWALDVIGADEPLPVDDREWDNVQNRNKLRAEQRLKLKGDIDDK